MILTSSFSLRPKHGFPTSLQLQRTQIHNCNKYKVHKSFIDFLPTMSISKFSFGSSYGYKLVTEQKVHRPTFCAQSTNEEFILQQKNDHIKIPESNLWRNVDVFLRFCRLHSIIGGIIGLISISLLPVTSLGDLSPGFFIGFLKVLIPIALINTYTTCLNQVTDVEIDKVNKPYFVLASGEYTMEQGKAIVGALALMAFTMGILFNSPSLLLGLVAYFFVGTAYSVNKLPLLRWKKNPFLAAFAIINAELIIPIVSFIHTQTYVLGRPLVFTRPFAFTLFCNTLFSIAIALMKDIPDMEGDQAFGIQTFSLMYGKRKVFDICRSIMLTVYGCAMLMGALSSSPLNKLIIVLGHGALGCILWTRSQSLNLDDIPAVESFYMFIWKLFYAEYLLVHFLR